MDSRLSAFGAIQRDLPKNKGRNLIGSGPATREVATGPRERYMISLYHRGGGNNATEWTADGQPPTAARNQRKGAKALSSLAFSRLCATFPPSTIS